MNNKPYFENVYTYGDLYLDKILLEYEFFSYSILKDNKGKFFVCYCYEVEKRQSWLINEIKIENLISFLLNKIDIKSIFLFGDSEKIIITRNYDSGKEKSESVNTNKIIKMSILPDENEFLDKKEELNEYINLLTVSIKFEKQFCKYIWTSHSSSLSIEDDLMIIHKKINNNIANSSSIILGINNYINYKPLTVASLIGTCVSLSFNDSKIKENKNYAKAT